MIKSETGMGKFSPKALSTQWMGKTANPQMTSDEATRASRSLQWGVIRAPSMNAPRKGMTFSAILPGKGLRSRSRSRMVPMVFRLRRTRKTTTAR